MFASQGDPNVPAGQLTLDIDLSRPVQLPDLEHQQNIEELSRLVMGVHEEIQRGAPGTVAPTVGTSGAESSNSASGSGAVDAESAETSNSQGEPQPFVLPLGVMARNEVYPRSCKIW